MSASPFGILPAGHSLVTEPSSRPSDSSLLYNISTSRPFSHLVVFILPGSVLPPDTAAAIYLTTASDFAAANASGQAPNFKFLGGVGFGKESAVFKVASSSPNDAGFVLGISVEPASSVASRAEEVSVAAAAAVATIKPSSSSQSTQLVLAQRIIKNAFAFLTSFSGRTGPAGVEVVPLKAFEDWWRKFESRIRADPSFLERDMD